MGKAKQVIRKVAKVAAVGEVAQEIDQRVQGGADGAEANAEEVNTAEVQEAAIERVITVQEMVAQREQIKKNIAAQNAEG